MTVSWQPAEDSGIWWSGLGCTFAGDGGTKCLALIVLPLSNHQGLIFLGDFLTQSLTIEQTVTSDWIILASWSTITTVSGSHSAACTVCLGCYCRTSCSSTTRPDNDISYMLFFFFFLWALSLYDMIAALRKGHRGAGSVRAVLCPNKRCWD